MHPFRSVLTNIARFLLCLGCALAGTSFAADAPAPAYIRTIYLVRHGAYDRTQSGDETVSKGLTPLGIAQARLVAARLRGLPVSFTSLAASTLTRARETGQVIGQALPALPLQASPLLRECVVRTRRTEAMKGKSPAELDAAEAQLNQAFATYFVPATGSDQHDILVCHANVIRYLVMKALRVDPQALDELTVAHASLTIIQVTPQGACNVRAAGDAGHIPPNLLSGLGEPDPTLEMPPSRP